MSGTISISWSFEDFAKEPAYIRRYFSHKLGLHGLEDADGGNNDEITPDLTPLAELSSREAYELIRGCSAGTLEILRSIVRQGAEISIGAIATDVKRPADSMRGSWSGLTKRTRTVTGHPTAILIDWYGEPDWKKGVYVDQKGRVSEATHAALRRGFETFDAI